MADFDLAIIGAGASGMAAAIAAGKKTKSKVILLERLPRAGKKILATGNGRCNLGNAHALTHEYHNRAFALPALRQFEVWGFFRSLGLLLYEDAEGRLYPRSNTAASVLDALRFAVARAGVELRCDAPVHEIKRVQGGFRLHTPSREIFAQRVVISAGGCAAPAQGSDGSGFSLLRSVGHNIIAPRPALVQLQCRSPLLPMLKGQRCRAIISLQDIDGKKSACAEGEILFTEDGLSGIAAMEISRTARPGMLAALDLLPEYSIEELTALLQEFKAACPEQPMAGILPGILPKRIGEAVQRQANSEDSAILAKHLKNFMFPVTGTRGFAHAQVTAGGADVKEFNAKTLESQLTPGLFVCGEVLDVDGGCGGFNLHWAWASGLRCGSIAGTCGAAQSLRCDANEVA